MESLDFQIQKSFIVCLVFQDLTKSQSCRADEMAKAQRPAVFADINICLSSTFSYQKRTLELNEKGVTEAGKFLLARCHVSFAWCVPQSMKI